jgi:hypothetical protein
MSPRYLTGLYLIGAVFAWGAASPALACKGATPLLRDDFKEADPSWDEYFTTQQSFVIGGGKVSAKTQPGSFNVLFYQGDFFPAGDACVTITNPSGVRDPTNVSAGIVLQADDGSWYMPVINLDGTAGVERNTNAGWLDPVTPRRFPAIKQGTNVLRVVWKGPPPKESSAAPDPNVAVFINDQQFITFKMPPNANRQFGLTVQSEGHSYQFTNLVITK